MDEDRPTLSYRTPAAAAPDAASTPSEQLADLDVPMLGKVNVELGLAAPIRLSLDREELRVTPGSGVRVRATGLPPLLLRHLRIDLSTAAFEHDATGLGAFEARAVSVALGAAFTHLAPWQPGRSIVDLVMQNLPQRADGRRRVWGAGPASVWVDPDTRLDLAVTPEALELALSHAVYLRVIGLGIGLLAVRYLFGRQRLEIEGPRGQPLRNALLRFVAWVATRYLRKRLPAALAVPGYDPFADPDRRAHFQQLAAAFAPKQKPTPAPSDSPTTATRQKSNDDLAARLASLKDIHFSPGPLPAGTRLIAVVPLGARGSLALCTHKAGNLDIRRRGPRLSLDATAGLFLHAEQVPGLEDQQIRHIAVAFGPLLVEVVTQPPLGSFTQAVIQKIARTALTTKIPPATLARLEALGTSDELLRQPMGETAELTLTTPRNDEILLRHGPEALELSIPAGLDLKFHGLDMIPDATIKGVRYTWATGDLKLDAMPELGDLGNMFVTQLVRHRAAPLLPRQLGARGPDASLPIDPTIAQARQAILYSQTLPAVGSLQVRLNPADTVALSLSASSVQLNSNVGIAVLMPDLQIALVLKHFRFEVGARGLATDMQLGDYLTEQLTRLLEKMALPPMQRGLPMWKSGLDPMLPWQIIRIDAGPLGPIDVNLGPGGAFVVERTSDAIEIRSDPFLEIRAERQDFVPILAFRKIRWEPATDAWTVEFDPPVGPLIPEAMQRIAHALAGPILTKVTQFAALPAPPTAPLPPSAPPPVAGDIVFEKDVPKIGAVRVAADPNHVVDIVFNRRAADITLGSGLVARMPGLGFNVQVNGIRATMHPLGAHLDTKPDAGPLFDHIIEHTLRTLLHQHADKFWPTDEATRIGQDTLLVLGRGQAWGPLRVCVPTDGDIRVHLDKQGFALRSEGGIFISGQAIDWLPDFYLHTLGYAFEDGAVTLEISGIEETYYHEEHPVSPVTQALLAHLIKVLALPKLPAWTAKLGLRSFPLPPVPAGDPGRISMYRLKLPGEFGEVQISMPPDDTVTVRIDDNEASVISERGLFATLPGLRFELQLRGVRYHMHSGEIQVGGLGQLENALLEAVVARQLHQKVPQIADETPAEVTSALSTLLDQLPVDDRGRRVLFSHALVNLLLPENPCLIVRFTADGLAFTSDPPIIIDGPARIDFAFNGIRYSFADTSFHLDLGNAGAVVSGIFTPIIINQAEKRLNNMFKPLLPAPMRQPGYSLATDPRSEEHILDIIEGFALLGKKKKAKA